MLHSDVVLEAIYQAVDEVNQLLPSERRVHRSPKAILFGSAGTLDSLAFVQLIVAVEQRLQEAFGVSITLADERAMSQANNPFKSIESMKNYITGLLAENGRG